MTKSQRHGLGHGTQLHKISITLAQNRRETKIACPIRRILNALIILEF